MNELLTLSEGAVLTHLVTRAELADGVLLAADDLRLWARLADGAGVPLAGGGRVRTSVETGEPVLTGPEGWLAGVEPEQAVALRLRGGAFELSVVALDDVPAERALRVVQEFGEQALDTLRAFAEGLEPSPGVPIDVVVLELLMKAPETFADPLPPLAPLLAGASLELRGGRVGIVGAPWEPESVAGLAPLDVIRLALVRSALRTYGEGADLSKAVTYLSRSDAVLERIADEVEREPLGPALAEALPRTEPAALLLLARSAEGQGRSFEASGLVSEALSLAPELAPAERDAAEYAACRTEPGAPLPERAEHLFRQLLVYAYRPARRRLIEDLVGLSVRVAEPALADLALFEHDVVGEFLDARAEWLRDDEVELLESWRRTPLRLWEVVAVTGEEVTVGEGEERVTLRDPLLSRQAVPGDLMLTRLLGDGSGPHVFGHPFKVDPARAEEMRALLADPVDPYAVAAFFRRPPA
ncbi:hypothetical protein FHS43_003316 [Streptosporangium becharense]|uniref:Uncharacterized protein n=1 Tax=Streptosporangium becharense TaxID=1816182 RepID=A0A7W9ID96_9ACTN|nr:hypothetical protein [Streptosporangium becharense]MBB2912036.1 hypothetical protein [Streptosporangium becharense]MBB5818583.1 hypothetical protein [Streptosporangium becharense]